MRVHERGETLDATDCDAVRVVQGKEGYELVERLMGIPRSRTVQAMADAQAKVLENAKKVTIKEPIETDTPDSAFKAPGHAHPGAVCAFVCVCECVNLCLFLCFCVCVRIFFF